jgi:hypothetical protein
MRTRRSVRLVLGLLAFGSSAASAVWAQAGGQTGTWKPDSFLMSILSTLVFGLIGVVVAIIGFKLFDAMIPFNLEQEICEKQNLAVALLCAGMMLGICIIVAAAVF